MRHRSMGAVWNVGSRSSFAGDISARDDERRRTGLGKPCNSRSLRNAASEFRISPTSVDRRREPLLMPQQLDLPVTSWEASSFRGRSPQLLFGAMYEDPAIELEAFPPRSRVFCIASAGCTARALSAAGHDVTAVDINPRQLRYAQERAGGAPPREGVAERMLRTGRALLSLLGCSERRRREFLSLRDPIEQVHYWRQTLDSLRWRCAVDSLLSKSVLRLIYAGPFLASLPRHFGAQIRARLQRGWAHHSNRSNPYAWRLLLGETAV